MNPSTTFGAFWSLRHSTGGHPLTAAVSQRLGAALAWLGYRLGLSPSAITLLGLGTFLAAALAYAALPRTFPSVLLCLSLLQLGYGLDCADGQLARATNRSSAFGAWLDVACDHVRTAAISVAALYWLVDCGSAFATAAACAALFIAGAHAHIHTATALRGRDDIAALSTRGAAQPLRWIATAILDTATVLLVIGILRSMPALLAPYLAGMGIVYLSVSGYLARARLSAAR